MEVESEIESQAATIVEPVGKPDRVRSAMRKSVLRPFSCSIFAAVGIFGGLSSLFVGLVSVMIHAMVPVEKVFDRVGTILLVAAIPMILVGSVFLDAIDCDKS